MELNIGVFMLLDVVTAAADVVLRQLRRLYSGMLDVAAAAAAAAVALLRNRLHITVLVAGRRRRRSHTSGFLILSACPKPRAILDQCK